MWTRSAAGLPLLTSLVLLISVGVATAHANRFGPPWQARVVVDQATLLSQPDPGSAPVGPLARDQLVVVVNETSNPDGTGWTQTPDGWIASNQVAEDIQPRLA